MNFEINNAWVLLFLPLAVAAVNWLLLKSRPNIVALVATLSCFVTLVFSIGLLGVTGEIAFAWLPLGDDLSIDIGIMLDDLSTRMMIVVTGIGFLVHLFSLGYMENDECKARYFSGLSLFMFSMTGIVLANNIAMTFVFWELVGVSSYLLIGHWFTKNSAADAAKKAFITNRVGDFGFMIGLLTLWAVTKTLSFSGMAVPAGTDETLLTIMVLCLFCGAVGKSAQFPLHVWLPDAMEGPTPVSALIHAATMVAAGVYMMVRVQASIGVESFTETACTVITVIGLITAAIAALMATQQNDIKKILAYSTLSQLGLMITAVGLLAGDAAMFHLFTHAWFKGLLFLGAGAIIYACHHEQDIWKMGGLYKRMPLTSLTFIVGTLALIAFPFTSGFFSKEEILIAAGEKSQLYFWGVAGVSLLTTFYMVRACLVVFFGKGRSESAEHAHEVGGTMLIPLLVLAFMALISGWGFVADRLVPFNEFEAVPFHVSFALYVSIAVLIAGVVVAAIFYGRHPKSDPLAGNAVSRLFENKFYIDKFYDEVLVKWVQGVVATTADFIDQLLIGGMVVGGVGRLSLGVGTVFRKLQSGALPLYALLFTVGMLLILYFTVFYS